MASLQEGNGKGQGNEKAPDGLNRDKADGDHISEHHWLSVKDKLRAELGSQAFETWLKGLDFHGIDGNIVSLAAKTPFIRDWVRRHYADRIRDFWRQDNPNIAAAEIHVAKSNPAPAAGAQAAGDKRGRRAAQGGSSAKPHMTDSFGNILDPRYHFDSFIVGKSNELAHAAAQRLAEGSSVPFNPLFLHGGVGLGKTHLMHAIANETLIRHPKRKVLYLSAERFMFQFISALRHKDTVAFKQQFRSVDLLMIDDVQFIAHKNSTQEEFFHTFNALIDNRRQVVISADRSPTDLQGIEERIISRLGWGLVADIHPTDYELRLGILQSKAEQVSEIEIPCDVLEFLARKITSNIRELEGAMNRVVAYATLVGRPVSLEVTRDVLRDLLRANDRRVSIDQIQRQVADYYNIRLADLLSARRTRQIARPRQIAMYLAKQMTPRSLPEIGRKFGGRDHTTVMHAVRKVDDLRQSDHAIDDDLNRLSRLLES